MKTRSYFALSFIFISLLASFTASAGWKQLPGSATDIGVNGGQVYVIGTDAMSDGYSIHHWQDIRGKNGWCSGGNCSGCGRSTFSSE